MLHAENDEFFAIGGGRAVLAVSPATGPDEAWVDRISARMARSGFSHDGADKRLYPIGNGHEMNDGPATPAMVNACLDMLP